MLRGTVVTMDDARSVIEDGRVLVRDGVIVAVWSGPSPPPGVVVGGAVEVDAGPDALIFPGLVNLHGHPAYDVLPMWLAPSDHARPDDGRPTGREPFGNRYQWNDPSEGPAAYQRLVASPKAILASSRHLDLGPETVKWAEAMSILGGQTTFEGDGVSYPETDFILARNVDFGAFCSPGGSCPDPVDSRVSSVMDMSLATCRPDPVFILADCPSMTQMHRLGLGETHTYIVHVAEGLRDGDRPPGDEVSSRAEFHHLASLGLLTEHTVIVHGVALEQADFVAMRVAPSIKLGVPGDGLGARLVWSPLSNLLLYGKTAHVHEALRVGVLVSLGTDWTPGGSRHLLDELKVADVGLRDPRILGGERFLDGRAPTPSDEAALDRVLVEMATRNPALTVRAFDRIGSLEPGKLADVLVVGKPARSPTGGMPDSPYRALIDATPRDVRLVLVGGEPVAGDVSLLQALKPGDFEIVPSERGGYQKAIDVTDPRVPGGNQTLAEVRADLTWGLDALGGGDGSYRDLKARLDNGAHAAKTDADFLAWLKGRYGEVDGRVNLERIALNPLLVDDDPLQFDALAARFDASGRVAAAAPPYAPYPSNANHVQPLGNPFAPDAYETRWYPERG